MKKHIEALAALAAEWAPDAGMVAGAGAISYGAGLIYVPAGWIVGGAFLLAVGCMAAKGGK